MELPRQDAVPAVGQLEAPYDPSSYLSALLGDAPLLSSSHLGWEGLTVERYRHPPREDHLPPLSNHVISLYLGEPLQSVQWLDDEILEGQAVRGDVIVKAAGVPHGWKRDEPADVLNMQLDPGFLSKVAAENDLDPARAEIVDYPGGADPHVEHIGLALQEELRAGGGAGGRLYAESLATALALHFMRGYATTSQQIEEIGRGLPARALGAVTDLVHDELSRDLSLAELAQAANLSTYHFSRLFKESTGLSPHQYVIWRRVDRAKTLLASGAMPLHQVARAVGFSHQQHLGRHFKRLVGVTPGRYRELAAR